MDMEVWYTQNYPEVSEIIERSYDNCRNHNTMWKAMDRLVEVYNASHPDKQIFRRFNGYLPLNTYPFCYLTNMRFIIRKIFMDDIAMYIHGLISEEEYRKRCADYRARDIRLEFEIESLQNTLEDLTELNII